MEARDTVEVLKEVLHSTESLIQNMESFRLESDNDYYEPTIEMAKLSKERIQNLINSIIVTEEAKLKFLNNWVSKNQLLSESKNTFTCRMCGEQDLSTKAHLMNGSDNICFDCRESMEG